MKKIHLASVDSTNTWVKEHYQELDASIITRVTTSEQTHGRGRFNRTWISPKDQNIYVTYFFTLPKASLHLVPDRKNTYQNSRSDFDGWHSTEREGNLNESCRGRVQSQSTKDELKNGENFCGQVLLGNITQLLSFSMTKLLTEYDMEPQIKWPNDLLVSDKKIGGILCETIDLGNDYGIVLGAGLNVNMPPDVLETIDQKATSFFSELRELFTLDPLLDRLDALFTQDLERFKREGFQPFLSSYEELLAYKGEPITLKVNAEVISGILHSLNPDGRLNLLLPSGETKTVSSGEVQHDI